MPLERQVRFEAASGLTASSPAIQSVLALVEAFHAAVPLTSLLFRQDALPAPIGQYTYTFTDGLRTWTQKLTFANAADHDPYMTFTVNDGWKESEFAQQRLIRAQLQHLRAEYQVTFFRVLWTLT